VWLLSPVAAEVAAYGDVTISRPALAAQFLQAARRREASAGVDVQEGGWGEGEEADEVRLRWAFGEAKRLLAANAAAQQALQDQMAAGASVGGSVLLLEERLKGRWGSV